MSRVAIQSFCFACIALLIGARAVAAQSALYVTGAGFAEIKQFDTITYDPLVLDDEDDFSMDATGAGGAFRVGTFLHPRWTLELAVEAGAKTRKDLPNPYASIRAIYPTLRVPELSASTRFLTASTVIGFHPAKLGRMHLGYLGGFTFVRGIYESALPDFRILPAAPLPILSGGFGSAQVGISSITGSIFPPPDISSRTVKRVDMSAGAILGFEAAVDLGRRLAAVPGIRAITFSNNGQTVLLIRPEVGVRWSF